ncbi:MAG: type I restriction endonuclease, partial [Bacteroidota bacterium]
MTGQQELEWKTRKERIDRKLQNLSQPWKIIKYKEGLDISKLTNHAVEEYPTKNGPADYVLFVKGKLLGIIEGKKVGVGPQNVLEQAKRYSRGVENGIGNWRGYRVPFLFASNGEVIYYLDVRNEINLSRKISNFHTPDALEEFYNLDKTQCFKWFKEHPIVDEKIRPYQKEAVEATEEAIAKGKRAMLIAMATGTGKT